MFVLSIFLFSCDKNITIKTEPIDNKFDSDDTYKGEGIKRWEDIGETFEKACVTDEETAVKIADAIILQLQNNGYLDSVFSESPIYLISSFYDIEDKVWIMTYGNYDTDESGEKIPVPGTDFCLAISENDGRILRMWCT